MMKKNMLASIIFVTMFFVSMFAGASGTEDHGRTGARTPNATGTDGCSSCDKSSAGSTKDDCLGLPTSTAALCKERKRAAAAATTKPAAPAAAGDQHRP
jgi:hypothetical protein